MMKLCSRLAGVACVLLGLVSSADAQTATGTYTGDGTGARAIMSLGFQPDIVIIKADNAATEGIIRTSTMATGSRPIWNGSVLLANNITSLDANGFTVGSDIRVNGLNVCGGGGAPCEYYWTAFKADANIVVDTYSGDGAATQAIMGVGFAVDYVMIYGDGNKWPRNRTSFPSTTALGAGANFRIRNAGENSTSIPSLDANGFTVPWCTTRDLGPQLSCTHGFEVPHEHFQTHSAEVCEEGLSREELA